MDARIPRYRVVVDYLLDGIQSGRFDTHRRLPSEMELAHKFATSRPTVVRAMQELRSLGLIDRRVGSGTFIRRAPAGLADKTTLGLIVSGLGNTEILTPISAEITCAAESQNCVVIRGGTSGATDAGEDFSPEQAQSLCRQYIQQRVAGVFFAPLEIPEDRVAVNLGIVRSLQAAGIAVVLVDRDATDFPERSQCDLVGIDNFAAGFNLATHLLQSGRRHIRFVCRPRYPSTTEQRMAGCQVAMARQGIDVRPDWCRTGDPADADFVGSLLRPERPEAIICANDLTAAVLMRTLGDIGLSFPSDMALAGFDDVRYATLLSPPLTTMRQPCRSIGVVATQMMLERIRTPALPPRQVLLSAELVARRSTAVL